MFRQGLGQLILVDQAHANVRQIALLDDPSLVEADNHNLVFPLPDVQNRQSQSLGHRDPVGSHTRRHDLGQADKLPIVSNAI